MANFKAPCKWCEFGQVFNGQLGHLCKLGDWKTAEIWPMLKFFWSESFKILFQCRSFLNRHPRVLSIQVGEIFLCLFSINSPTRFARRRIKIYHRRWREKNPIDVTTLKKFVLSILTICHLQILLYTNT